MSRSEASSVNKIKKKQAVCAALAATDLNLEFSNKKRICFFLSHVLLSKCPTSVTVVYVL